MEHKFKRYYGQNFLVNVHWQVEFVQLAEIADEFVVEIGPGEGAVTNYLLQKAKKLTVVEIDHELIPRLKDKFSNSDNFNVVQGSILAQDIAELTGGDKYHVVGSLPYNISKKIISFFLKASKPPVSMTVLIQKEVAQKYSAKVPNANALSNFAHLYADVEYKASVPKHAFYPEPEVDGGIVRFENIRPRFANIERLNKFIRLGFSQPRKTLLNNLQNYGFDKQKIEAELTRNNLPTTIRAHELDLKQWNILVEALHAKTN